ncbi:MAG: hypothetical protein LDL30_09440 [Desulfovibrio sp.]|nr:hypothetical protein [Desulfovibrio sp.]MCA1985853.1 hypothetical protein [Desulfovibrio sp.]
MRRVHPLLVLAAGTLLLTAACVLLLWALSAPSPTVVHANGTALQRTAPLRPIPPPPGAGFGSAPAPTLRLEAPPPDDMLTDLATALISSHTPAHAPPGLDLPGLAARYVPTNPAPLSPALLSLGYYVTAEPLVQRLVWQAHQAERGGLSDLSDASDASGQPAAAIVAGVARSARDLAACTEADQSPNCIFALQLLAAMTSSPEDAAALQVTARSLLQDLADRLDRATGAP